RHHVVDTQRSRVPQVVAKRTAQIRVAIGTLRRGQDGVEAPVLSTAKKRVRWRTDRDAFGEELPESPRIVAVRMNPQRQVQIEAGGPAATPCIGQSGHLLFGLPRGVEVAVLVRGLEVSFAQFARSQGLRPCGPARALPVADRA